jgi:hypothetical protein
LNLLGGKMMESDNYEHLIDGWLSLQRVPEGSQEYDALLWAHAEFSNMVEENPEAAWILILEILERERDEEVLAVLAAGPLEELLSTHGPDFIDRVEAEAAHNGRFAWLLSGVYRLFMSDEVWKRVQSAAPERW